jgi:tRNA G18 (ribose-2'-O)-methylase SpoU
MRRTWPLNEEQYFGIGIYQPKTEENIGTLWRTAYILGAQFIFIIGKKYTRQKTDTTKAWSKIPLFQFENTEAFLNSHPYSCLLVGIEMDKSAENIHKFQHPQRAIYLLGSEDKGLPKQLKQKCHYLVQLPGESSLNVSVAGSIVLYDRISKQD